LDGKPQYKLVHINKPLLRVPNLAIHLNRETNEKFSPNKETHLAPILATQVQEQLNGYSDSKKVEKLEEHKDKHHSVLIDFICKELNCSMESIQGFNF